MELNVWCSTTIHSVTKKGSHWEIKLTRNGEERIVRPKYVVFAIGLASGVPNMPSIPGMVNLLVFLSPQADDIFEE